MNKSFLFVLIISTTFASKNIIFADEQSKTWIAHFQKKSDYVIEISCHSEYSNALKVVNELSNMGYIMNSFSATDYNAVNDLKNFKLYIKIIYSGKYKDGNDYNDSIGTYVKSISEGLELADANLLKIRKEVLSFSKPLDHVKIDCVKISQVYVNIPSDK